MRIWAAAFLTMLLGAQSGLAAELKLTPEGWGPLKVGMTETAAIQEFGLKESDDPSGDDSCHHDLVPGQPQLRVMINDGKIVRLSLYRPGPFKTDRGLGIGARESEVKRAYPRGLQVQPHAYDDGPAHYLTVWTVKDRRGVRYETDTRGRVTAIHVGDRSIEYIEGCL